MDLGALQGLFPFTAKVEGVGGRHQGLMNWKGVQDLDQESPAFSLSPLSSTQDIELKKIYMYTNVEK